MGADKTPTTLPELIHDLRNPLNTIALSASLLGGDQGLSADQRKHVERIERAVAKIEAMVNALVKNGEVER